MSKRGILSLAVGQEFGFKQKSFGHLIVYKHNQEKTSTQLISGLIAAPFDLTFYFSPNCLVLASLDPLFKLLQNFDIVLSHESKSLRHESSELIPNSFPYFSTAVIGVRKSELSKQFLHDWAKLTESKGSLFAALREVCWTSKLRLAVLPPEWNIQDSVLLDLWFENEVQPYILNTNNALVSYNLLIKPLPIIDSLRYNWRKLKEICWTIKHC